MTSINHAINALDLWFRPGSDTKLYKVRIDDPQPGLTPAQIRSACSDIEKSMVFDFNDDGEAYRLVKAHYYRRNSRTVIK